jgi:hypothetical protein
LYILDDAGRWTGGVAPGTALVLTRTGQGSLHCGGTTAQTVGSQTTVNWQISVPTALAGANTTVHLYCESRSAYDGWRRLGQLTITQ